MNERDFVILMVGAVIGYCACFVFEIFKLTRPKDQPDEREPEPRRKDPADWWKECE